MLRVSIIVMVIFVALAPAIAQSRLLVFAAASLSNVMQETGKEFEKQCRCEVTFSFAGSGTLARQIDAGAPADIFVSADTIWMDWLRNKGAMHEETIQVIAGNRLVVAVSNKTAQANDENSTAEIVSQLLNANRIAMAEPHSVPAGRYSKQALERLGLWQKLSKKFVYGENVRVSLSLAARGDVDTAIIYLSDAKIEPRVKIAYVFKKNSHDKVLYPAGLVKATVKAKTVTNAKTNLKAIEFMNYLTSQPAQQIFQRFGFTGSTDDR